MEALPRWEVVGTLGRACDEEGAIGREVPGRWLVVGRELDGCGRGLVTGWVVGREVGRCTGRAAGWELGR